MGSRIREGGSRATFRDGVALLPRALGLLRQRRELWIPAAIPAVLTVACLALAASLFSANAASLHAEVFAALPRLEAGAWYSWLWLGPAKLLVALLGYALLVVAAALAALLGLVVATLLSSPVLDELSRRVERVLAGAAAGDEERASASGIARDAIASLSNEMRRLAWFLLLWGAITLAGFVVPGGVALVPVALAVVAVVFLPLEYAGFALDRRRVAFAARRAWLASQRAKALGFGAAGFAVGLVPGLNFLLLPVLIVAGTLLVLERPPSGSGDGL